MIGPDRRLRCVVLSGTEISHEIAGVLADWHRAGVVDDAVLTFAENVDLRPTSPFIPASKLSEMQSDSRAVGQRDLVAFVAHELDLEGIRSVLVHDCDVAGDYYHTYEGIRHVLSRQVPQPVSSQEDERFNLRFLSLYAPISGGTPIPIDATRTVLAPGVVLAPEDRAQPHGVADMVRRESTYAPHVAAAIVTLCGMWREFPMPELDDLLLRIDNNSDQVRAIRQMVRIARGVEPLEEVTDRVAAVLRGDEDPGTADLGVIRRGPATDRRLVDGAFQAVLHAEGTPVLFHPASPGVFSHVLGDAAAKRKRFLLREIRETFTTSLRRSRLRRERRERADKIGAANEVTELAERVDVPSRRLAQLGMLTGAYAQGMEASSRDPDVASIPPQFFDMLMQRAFSLVDGGAGERDADAVRVLADRTLVAPDPRSVPESEPALLDELGRSVRPFEYLDQWACRQWVAELHSLLGQQLDQQSVP